METTNKMLEPLKHIKKVEPPSSLFSKIESRMREELSNTFSMSKLVAAGIILIILISGNTLLIKKELTNNPKTDLTNSFGINVSNQLYNE